MPMFFPMLSVQKIGNVWKVNNNIPSEISQVGFERYMVKGVEYIFLTKCLFA